MKTFGALSIPNPPQFTASIPDGIITTHVRINLSGGEFNPSTISLSDLKQASGGKFSINAELIGDLDFSTWHEIDVIMVSDPPHSPPPQTTSFESTFKIKFDYIKLSTTIEMKLDDTNNLAPTALSAVITDNKFSYDLPNNTGLKASMYSCVESQVHSTIDSQITAMTDAIAGCVHIGINKAFEVIPESGKLTDDITYLFPGTPGGLLFPNDNGVQYCVLGQVQWKGTNAPGDIGTVPFPPVPTDGHDALFYINNYGFNALFWAFYNEGDLHFSFNKTNISYEPALTTKHYNNTPLQAIYDQYPDRNMVVDLALNAAPTIQVLADEADITYNGLVTFYVAKEGSETEKDAELFSLDVTEVDALEHFSVGTNANSLQLIIFRVQTLKDVSVKVVSSNIASVDVPTVEMVWKFTLSPIYADILSKAAETGVPLPSSLQNVFTNYAIQLKPGYVSAAVNFTSKETYERVLKECHGCTISSLTKPLPNISIE